MYSKQIDIEALREENFQLKNQITDLKNGFDLNRDVLKILQEQSKETQPKLRIFYQIISRLTGVNNQIMLANIDLIQQRNKLKAQKLKLDSKVQIMSEKIEELTENLNDLYKPKEIYFQFKEEIKNLHTEVMASNEECLRKKFEISHLQKIIKEKELAQMKKPIIPSVSTVQNTGKITLTETQIEQIPKTYMTNDQKKYECLFKEIKRQNKRLNFVIQELEYRLTLLSRIYNMQAPQHIRQIEVEEQKNLSDQQLSLLLFALHNTELHQQNDNETIKLTITKRCKLMEKSQKDTLQHCKSLPIL